MNKWLIIRDSGETINVKGEIKIGEATKDKWEGLGFLDDLKGSPKESISQLFECEASFLLSDTPLISKEDADKILKDDHGWVVYIVECSDGTYYTGITNDLPKRLLTHNMGKGAKYTRGRLPVALMWFKKYENKSIASQMEYRVKKLTRKQKEGLMKYKFK